MPLAIRGLDLAQSLPVLCPFALSVYRFVTVFLYPFIYSLIYIHILPKVKCRAGTLLASRALGGNYAWSVMENTLSSDSPKRMKIFLKKKKKMQ